MFLSKIFPIDITLGDGVIAADAKSSITNLYWKTILKIQEANLAYIFQFTACLANLRFFISRIATWSPSKNSKWSCTYLTFLIIFRSSLVDNN